MKRLHLIVFAMLTMAFAHCDHPVERVEVSDNHRFFQTADGRPFFWLGDTGWLLFVKTDRNEARQYLDIRQRQGFNVIQVMVLHDMNNTINAYGDSALHNYDVSMPATTPGADTSNAEAYDYWDHVDFIVDEAAKRGIYMALVPTWGSNVKSGKINVDQAKAYAAFIASRYKDKANIIWLNGGDVRGTDGMEVWQTLGSGIKAVDSLHIMTFHPRGRYSSSEWFQDAHWLDFNMFQSGHKNYAQDTSSGEKNHFGEDNWKYIDVDYALQPTKPTLDGEPSYENIPQGLHDSTQPRWHDGDLRRYAYWSVFAGGAGFTYGENSVMQFNKMGDWTANYGVQEDWKETIMAKGATQMIHLKNLMLSKSYFDRVPAQAVVSDNGDKYDRIAATMGKGYAMFYTYTGRNFTLNTVKLNFKPVKASWMNPSTGATTVIEGFAVNSENQFDPPGEPANGNDWVLILE